MGGVYANILVTFTYLALAASSSISYAQKSELFLKFEPTRDEASE